MTQFVAAFVHSAQLLFIECNYPIINAFVVMFFTSFFIIMFGNFYVQAYKTDRTKKKNIKAEHAKIK